MHAFAPRLRHCTVLAIVAASQAFAAGAGAGAALAHTAPSVPAKPQEIVAYYESGAWNDDVGTVVDHARSALDGALEAGVGGRPALVLDIDDTVLSTYDCLRERGFERAGGTRCGRRADLPVIEPAVALFEHARERGVAVFFITGRRARDRRSTAANLDERLGGYEALIMRPDQERPGTHDGYKSRRRRAIERRGYRIVLNVGDQLSDLRGGHAEHRFKLPNPMYVIP